ncbi:hypothetical protein R6Q59_023295 [Mikania micrantha]
MYDILTASNLYGNFVFMVNIKPTKSQIAHKLGNCWIPNWIFIKDQMIQKHNCSEKNLVPLNGYEEFKNALDNGSVNVVIEQLPYINLFLDKYKFGYTKVGPIQQEVGIAFALPIGSDLLESFSRAVINITQSEIMTKMKTDYLKIFPARIKQQLNQAHPQSLDVQSFIGLLIFMAIVTISAIIISEFSLIRRDTKVGIEEECNEQPTSIYF